MNEEKKLAVDFTQFLLRSVAEDLEATKEVLGPGSPLSGTAARDAAVLLKNIAEGLNLARVINDPVIGSTFAAMPGQLPPDARTHLGRQLVICAEWPL